MKSTGPSAHAGASVNNFNQFGKSWQVRLQADGMYRDAPDDILNLYVRSAAGSLQVQALWAETTQLVDALGGESDMSHHRNTGSDDRPDGL